MRASHDLDPEEAKTWAEKLQPTVKKKCATWVRSKMLLAKRKEKRATASAGQQDTVTEEPGELFQRFSLNVRLQHGLMGLSVLLLIATGLPLKFHEAAWAKHVIDFFGGPEVTPILHRIGARLLIVVGVWPLAYIAFTAEERENFRLMLPRWQDARDAWQQILSYLGRAASRPGFDKFSYVEKFNCWDWFRNRTLVR